jgi:hypothetical protein
LVEVGYLGCKNFVKTMARQEHFPDYHRNQLLCCAFGAMAPPERNLIVLLGVYFLCLALPLLGQSDLGELRLRVTDPSGLAVKTTVDLVNEASEYRNRFATDSAGSLVAKRLPFGIYHITIQHPGFAEVSETVEFRSPIPVEKAVRLSLPSVTTSVTVRDSDTLLDPTRIGSSNAIGTTSIETRSTSLPGRSLQDLVNSQPGWLYEGNAVLHPRGSEYQTQFVLDGVPLTANRSPSFAPEIEADDVESLNIYTAGFPAEFGRELGGVVEVNTLKDTQPGWHGQAEFSGGSFDTVGGFAKVQYMWKGNALGASADGTGTGHYLNPVVPENYTNNGTTGDFALNYERDLTANDRLDMVVRHGFSRFQIPNEEVQQTAGQRQHGDNAETMGIVSYEHVFSTEAFSVLHGMIRNTADDLTSNPESTPILAFLQNKFSEGYFNGSIALHRRIHEWKFGMESDAKFLHENFNDTLTDRSQFPLGTPGSFAFRGSRPDLEQSAYIQNLLRLGNWTVSAGLRWDHYQLLVNQNAVSPRVAVGRFFPSAGLVLHASYDRIFQTPAFENLLLSSSPQVVSLSPSVLRLPVKPSQGNYFEVGATKAMLHQFRLDVNYYRRYFNNFADDDQLLNTAVSFPIAFNRAVIYGAEGKVELPSWRGFSGFVSYSYMVGNAYFPVTGGLFLADEAAAAKTQLAGHFPDSQDQRNTVRTRLRYQVHPRVWLAGSAEYGSGLPFTYTGTYAEALAQYGSAVVDRLDFVRGRVRPVLSIGGSLGAEVYKNDHLSTRLQLDGENLNDRLNVLDFGGLFSGNAIAPPRSYFARMQMTF